MPEQGRRGFLAEVQHRRVFRVAALYVVTAWVVLQVGDVIVEPLDLPEWTQRLVVTLAMLGFPIVIVLAWLFDVTPEGVVTGRVEDARPTTGRGLDMALVVIAMALVGFSVLREPSVAPIVTERPPETQGVPAHSIAVLPFDNLSGLDENAFFAAGIHEDILAHLAQIEALTVISRTSVLRYDETDLPLTEIAAELGVAHILEGSVRRAGDRVRISVQLIEAATDKHLWAETYDRDLTDVFAIQTEVANRIASAMEVELTGATAERLAIEPTRNLEAYDLYLTARTLPVTIDGLKAKVELNREAVALDPSFGLAWASIAEVTGGLMGLTGHTQALAEQGYAAATRALEFAPQHADSHLAMAAVLTNPVERRWEEAEGYVRRAIALNPNSALARGRYNETLFSQGRFAEAVEQARIRAILDPNDAVSHIGLAQGLSLTGETADAYAALEEAFVRAPDNALIANMAAFSYLRLDDQYAAVAQRLRAHRLDPNDALSTALLGNDLINLGDIETAGHWLRVAEETAPNATYVHLFRGVWYIAQDRIVAHLDFARDWFARTGHREAMGQQAAILHLLAWRARAEEDTERAAELLRQSLDLIRERLAPDKENGGYRMRPDNVAAVSILASVLNTMGDPEADRLHRKLAQFPDLSTAAFSFQKAIHNAYLGNMEVAIDSLERARRRGFNQLWLMDLYEENRNLDNLTKSVGWLEIKARIRAHNAETLARLRAEVPEVFLSSI